MVRDESDERPAADREEEEHRGHHERHAIASPMATKVTSAPTKAITATSRIQARRLIKRPARNAMTSGSTHHHFDATSAKARTRTTSQKNAFK